MFYFFRQRISMKRSTSSFLKNIARTQFRIVICIIAAASVGCAGAGEGAIRGAGSGALAGAASGLLTSLVWGGDPGYHMARGATAGATIGAIGGAVQGSAQASQDRARDDAQLQQDIEHFRRDIGNDAFDGVVALVECKYEVAMANARVAAQSKNSNHALAGLWLEALAYTDQNDTASIQNVIPEIVRWDRGADNAQQVDEQLRLTYSELLDIRGEFQLPRSCPP
jgi:hypothetical protein